MFATENEEKSSVCERYGIGQLSPKCGNKLLFKETQSL